MFRRTSVFVFASVCCALALGGSSAWAQTSPDPPPQSAQAQHVHGASPAWMFMQDGVLYGLYNQQGGPRGGTDRFIAPNWWMGMASKQVGRQRLTFNAMFSLDPAIVGRRGYREIFQAGETFDDAPLIDYQHPHDFFTQLAVAWRVPIGQSTSLTIAGGPVGEPALGPVAFMHRPSAAGLPFAPLGHHTFDSTHISFGVVTAGVEHGRWTAEGSVFNGHEPDDHRWGFDFAAMNSVSGRVSFRPTAEWELQVSTGHLVEPESFEPGNIQRTTASASWWRPHGASVRGVTVGYGINVTEHANRQAVFGEFTYAVGRTSMFGRAEAVQVETALLETGAPPATPADEARRDTVGAFTVGVDRNVWNTRAFTFSLGGAVTAYAVPEALRPVYGSRPGSVQVYFRLQPPAGSMGRMWNMRLGR